MPNDENISISKFHEYALHANASVQHFDSPPLSQFRKFTDQAKSLLINKIRSSFDDLYPLLIQVRPWLINLDLFSTAGLIYNEDAYTKLMAWVLNPEIHPGSAFVRQFAWFENIIPSFKANSISPVIPVLQPNTDDGVPDLVLPYSSFIIAIEAKTGSEEHATPSTGLPQTVAYPKALLRKYSLPEDFPVYMIFITPDGRKPENSEAIVTTYVEFCYSIITKLKIDMFSDELRFAFRMIFTHLLTCAVPHGVDLRSIIERYDNIKQENDNEITLLSNLGSILTFNNLFFPRRLL